MCSQLPCYVKSFLFQQNFFSCGLCGLVSVMITLYITLWNDAYLQEENHPIPLGTDSTE